MVAGMVFVGLGGALAVLAIMLRMGFSSATRRMDFNWKYYLCVGMSLIGTILAAVGFYFFMQTPVNAATGVDYSQILTVLSLLAAGMITGFFTFTYENIPEDAVLLPTCLSTCFVILFYIMFALISFYMGKSKFTHFVEGGDYFVPMLMWLLLAANMMYDYLDYERVPK